MGKLLVKTNKVLRLSNVLIRTLEIEEDLIEFEKIIHMMDMYLKSKGAKAVGPFIQYTDHIVNEDGTVKIRIQVNAP